MLAPSPLPDWLEVAKESAEFADSVDGRRGEALSRLAAGGATAIARRKGGLLRVGQGGGLQVRLEVEHDVILPLLQSRVAAEGAGGRGGGGEHRVVGSGRASLQEKIRSHAVRKSVFHAFNERLFELSPSFAQKEVPRRDFPSARATDQCARTQSRPLFRSLSLTAANLAEKSALLLRVRYPATGKLSPSLIDRRRRGKVF